MLAVVTLAGIDGVAAGATIGDGVTAAAMIGDTTDSTTATVVEVVALSLTGVDGPLVDVVLEDLTAVVAADATAAAVSTGVAIVTVLTTAGVVPEKLAVTTGTTSGPADVAFLGLLVPLGTPLVFLGLDVLVAFLFPSSHLLFTCSSSGS